MESAFGIDHVGKSFSPVSGTYKKATALSDLERKVVRAKASGKTVKLKTKSGGEKVIKPAGVRSANAPSAAGKKVYTGQSTKRGTLTKVVAARRDTGAPHGVEGFSQPDGRGGGRITVHDDVPKHEVGNVIRHEQAHISPKRNPHRFFQRVKDPVRLGREEGRADYTAYGRQTTGQYPGSDAFKTGYNEVQGKMAAAAYRKKLRKQ